MQSPSFESLISPPWPEKEASAEDEKPYHLRKDSKQLHQKNRKSATEDDVDDVAILGYN